MSGICGYLNAPAITGEELLHRMSSLYGRTADSETLTREGLDSGAASALPRGSLAQHGILATIEGHPHWSEPELAQVAADRGQAAAVVAGYRRYQQGFLSYLHGPFAIAILDPAADAALLAVDRLGIRPLAFQVVGTGLVFGSRLDSILLFPGSSREINLQALFDYIYLHMVPSPETIYLGMEKLLPGQSIFYQGGRVQRQFYWHAPYTETSTAEEPELQAELMSLLADAVDDCMPSAPVGAFLSGGLDSSTVTGLLAQHSPGPADAFGIGFSAEDYDEMDYARITAKRFGVDLHEYRMTPEDVIESIPRIAEAYDEPFGNASALPAYHCARLAQDAGKVMLLAGDGGDEIFAGNERYAKQKLFDLYHRVPEWVRAGALEPLLRPSVIGHLPLLRKARSYIEQARLPMPDRMESYNFLHRTPLDSIFPGDLLNSIDTEAPLSNIREVYQRSATDSLLKRMLHLDLKITLADNDLRKVNRMCELAGIDVVYPMLDERLVEFAARVPSDMLLHRLHLRSFYKQAVKGFLAPETLTKQKQGFGLPFGVWMVEHRPLQSLAYDSLASFKQRGYLRPDYIDRLIDQHRTGHAGYYGVMIWVLMMLEQWLQSHPPPGSRISPA